MKKLFVPMVFILFSLSGCLSTGFLGFLATTESVDKKIAEQEARIDQKLEQASGELAQQKTEVAQISADIQEFQGIKQQTEDALGKLTETEATVEELKTLIQQLETQMNTLPDETLKKLVEILQASLEQEAK